MKKVLNLFAGIGGNRALWGDEYEVTAVEFDLAIARAYKSQYPNDKVKVKDAFKYLLKHYKEYDFIWISPPCQSHSTIKNSQYKRESYNAVLPDARLWQVISFMQLHGRGCKWVVENVKPYYEPWIKPTAVIDRHYYWSNFDIEEIPVEKMYKIKHVTKQDAPFDLKGFGIKDIRQVIRNQVNPEIGLSILKDSLK